MRTKLDRHGQPRGYFQYRRNCDKAFRQLLGLLEGVASDAHLADSEIALLDAWLVDNQQVAGDPDVKDLVEDLRRIRADGIVTADEREDMLEVINTVLAYRSRVADREHEAISHLHGLIAGIAGDAELRDAEIEHLRQWLEAHDAFARSFPLDVVLDRLNAVLADGRVTEDERSDLLETIEAVQGGRFVDTGAASGIATRHGFDEPSELTLQGHRVCITGKFAYGPRKRVEQLIKKEGGTVAPSVRKDLSYLVVGTFASRDWVGTSHGRKIEQVLACRRDGADWPLLIGEEHWIGHLV